MEQLKAQSLSLTCKADQFDFETTEDITETTAVIGQERLTSSIEFGVGIKKEGFNIFALGPGQTNKREHIMQFLRAKSKDKPTPPDLCYVNNFDNDYKPKTLILPPGRGSELQRRMDDLLEDLIPTLTSAFENEEYQNRQESLKQEIQEGQDETFEELQKKARKQGLTLIKTSAGFSFAPFKDGDLMDEEEVRNMSEEKRKELEEKTKELQKELQKIIRHMPSNKRKMRERLKDLDKEIANYSLHELFKDIREDFSDVDEVEDFLEHIEIDIVDNVQTIMASQNQSQGQAGAMGIAQAEGNQPDSFLPKRRDPKSTLLDRYKVNLLVDHSNTKGAPVVYENNPTYKNLVGRVEYQSKMGALTTNFNLIKPGALHRANGGYLVLDARQLLLEPFAWEGFKRALKSNELKIESMGESYSLISTVSLEPEPIELNIKIALIGERLLYYLLCKHDSDFQSLFKVEADFEDEIDRTEENHILYAQLIAGLIKKHDLRHFDKLAIIRIIEQSARIVGDRHKLTTKAEEISDLLMEADYWAGKENHTIVQKKDVQRALDQQIYRSSRIRDKDREIINKNFIFIDTEGEAVGQVNGLSIIKIGNLMFGRPNRITVRTQLGKGKIINIEREVKMSGPIHSKGILILKGFLGERYAQDRPLSLSASIVFEQSYSAVDGDSASSAELYALLSSIGNIPLKQSFGVTGSVNQHGNIQPIGGVNEKIEGFFDICNERGLSGKQGLIIPEANQKNLMLKQEVINAVKADKFHIYAISTIDEGMELLTGLKMGKKNKDGFFPDDSINARIVNRLKGMAQKRKTFITSGNGKDE